LGWYTHGQAAPTTLLQQHVFAQLPEQLNSICEEAREIVQLYVVAAYSTHEMNARIEDRLRKFWQAFKVVRNYYVR
jgi:TRAP-type mannitol/chloroaromatic compound transport system substrate-binding protein